MMIFAISVIGFAIVHRIFLFFIPTSKKNYVRRIVFALFIGVTLIFFRKISSIILILGIFLLTQVVLELFLQIQRRKKMENWIFALLDETILHLRINKSLKTAMDAAITSVSDREISADFRKIYSNLPSIRKNFSSKDLLRPENVFAELFEISQLKVSTLDQVILYRKHLKLIYTLRHKSGQAAYQAQIQALILLFIFIFLTSALIFFFDWEKVETFFVTACFPMTLGLILVFRIGKWFKWKI